LIILDNPFNILRPESHKW